MMRIITSGKEERVAIECKTCAWYEPSYGMWCANGWTGDGTKGQCLFEHGKPRPTTSTSRCVSWEEKK